MIQLAVSAAGSELFDQLPKYSGVTGRLMGLTGMAVPFEEAGTRACYVKLQDVVKALVGQEVPLSRKAQGLLRERLLEITDSDTRRPASLEKLKAVMARFLEDRAKGAFTSEEAIVQEVEKLKREMSEIKPLEYAESLREIVPHLQPGDLLVRKYHEDHPNAICFLQKLFHQEGYREAFKCSHVAVYLGEIGGSYWVAEASMPYEGEAEVRRIKIEDPRFALKEKNQYLIFRNRNRAQAEEAARLARRYTLALLPEEEKSRRQTFQGGTEYTFLEAVRSLWHSSKMGYFGRQRLMKYYADYTNAIPFEYLGKERGFFCSHFAMIMESLAEMNKNGNFQAFMAKHPIPTKYDETKKGVALKVSKWLYSVRKGLWSRWMAVKYKEEVQKSVTTQLDALRAAPRSVVNYMWDHPKQFQVVGITQTTLTIINNK